MQIDRTLKAELSGGEGSGGAAGTASFLGYGPKTRLNSRMAPHNSHRGAILRDTPQPRHSLRRRLAFNALAAFIVLVSFPSTSPAVDIGGYDVANIAREMLNNLEEKKVISAAAAKELEEYLTAQPDDPLIFGPALIDFYSGLGAILVKKNIASQNDIDAAKKQAAESGGVKIGGLNPVVLAASYLDLLVQKGILTLPAAQSILDSAKSQ